MACYNMCKALAQRGVSIDFVVPYQAEHPEVDFMEVIPALPFSAAEMQRIYGGAYDSWRYTASSGASFSTAEHMPRTLREQQARYVHSVRQLVAQGTNHSVIHAHDWLTFEAAMAAKHLTGKPLIAHVHATEFDRSGDKFGNPLVHEIEYFGLTMADRIIAVSEATKRIIVREYSIPADKVEVVHNSINAHEFGAVEEANTYAYITHMKAKGYKVVVSTNRLTIQKGLINLLKAAQSVVALNPKVLFLLCGSGDQYQELIELSAEFGISRNVIFTNWIRGKQLRDAYAVADMFVMPSVSEPFGLSALEAVGYGNATLVSKQSGVCEVMNNVLKFDYWDVDRLADQILSLAAHPGFASELITQASGEFKKFSWHDAAAKYQRLYHATSGVPA